MPIRPRRSDRLPASELSDLVELVATIALLAYFALAIASYMVQGFLKNTENQFRNAGPMVSGFMWSLIAAEIGGFCVLLYGVMAAVIRGGTGG